MMMDEQAPDRELAMVTMQRAVQCYLLMLNSVGDMMAEACPPVGGPYRHRLGRMRSRLAFDAQPEALEESYQDVAVEMHHFAAKSRVYIEQHGTELRRAVAELEDIVRQLAQRQEFYGGRLRQFAAQLEQTEYPADPNELKDLVALQAAGLRHCVESMTHEGQSLLVRMREHMRSVEARLAESESTDALTGLMNRREMERRMEERKALGTLGTLLLFSLDATSNAEVIAQVAARLGTQFRHNDLVSRWSNAEFLVLFQAPRQIAESRMSQILPWVSGRYLLDTGDVQHVQIAGKVLEPEAALV